VFFNVAPIFAAAGLPGADASALAVIAPQILVSAAACLLMDAAGRRPLLLWASCVMSISAGMLGIAFSLPASAGAAAHPLALVGTFVFVSAFSVGMGPIPWVLMGELFPPRVRGVAASAATAVSNLAAFVVTVSFGSLVRLVGMGLAFFLYALFCAGCWAFTFFALPETKGRSLEQIGALLAADTNPWDEPPPMDAEEAEEGGAGEAASKTA
jgi:MFS family permease